jgi:hypothetical protein
MPGLPCAVERLQEDGATWEIVHTDDDWSTKFTWGRYVERACTARPHLHHCLPMLFARVAIGCKRLLMLPAMAS